MRHAALDIAVICDRIYGKKSREAERQSNMTPNIYDIDPARLPWGAKTEAADAAHGDMS